MSSFDTAVTAAWKVFSAQDYLSVRKYSEQLCQPLQKEDYIPQPVAFASPAKWHLAHTTWFFETFILAPHLKNYKVFHPDFGFLFNSYYNHAGERVMRANRGNITRPGVDEVYEFRRYVDQHMQFLMESGDLSTEILEKIVLGLHHEQQHQELILTDLKYIFGHNPTFPVYHPDQNLVDKYSKESGLAAIPEGVYEIGFEGNGFCYDNELGRHKVYLQSFEIAKSLVTNQQFLEFIQDGGYQHFDWWLDEGWSWVNQNNIKGPLYWHQIDHTWHYYTLAGLKPVNPNAILCHISFYEAAAFANWSGMRLPTEAEWEIAADQFQWGARWEWTNSAYLPYPGFKKAPGALGEYNGKFMVNQMVLRGASSATSPNHSRKTYRNFFHPHFQWQFSGIRLAKI